MGGIIVIDFIDMSNPENRKKLFDHLRDEMADDKAKHKILLPNSVSSRSPASASDQKSTSRPPKKIRMEMAK
jgi:hypothetical protein